MFDVVWIGIRERMHHLESQDAAIKMPRSNQIETRGSSMTQALRNVTSVRKTAVHKSVAPRICDFTRESVFLRSAFIRLDFPVVATRFDKMHGVSDAPGFGRNDFETESIFSFLQVVVGVVDLLIGGDANAVVVVVLFVRGAGVFMQEEQPVGIRMLHDQLSVSAGNNLERQQLF